ncbi:hypothetical protein JCM18909_3491 [Cutibacterium acnes JCM 18909]|nr:hypothetical protein JCM18909_3491 [Cutibacterium acnes JCM 18909]
MAPQSVCDALAEAIDHGSETVLNGVPASRLNLPNGVVWCWWLPAPPNCSTILPVRTSCLIARRLSPG